MDTQKGLMPGILTAWYTVLVAAAVFYGLGLFQDVVAIISANSTIIPVNNVLNGPYAWQLAAAILLEIIALVLPVMAAVHIYRRSRRGYYLAFASAAASAAVMVFTILVSEYPSALAIVLRAAICVAILVPAQKAKEYLFSREELGVNGFM